jgi:peptidoglycan/xylan/chitin deacetylase (PgdA/CDA1 family)
MMFNSICATAQQCLHIPVVVPFYHAVLGDRVLPHHGQSYRRSQDFIADLDFFLKYFNIIDLQDLLSYLDGKSTLPKSALMLTFDDGLHECSEAIIPLLIKKGVPAVFFLNNSALTEDRLLFPHLQNVVLHYVPDQENRQDTRYREARHLLQQRGFWRGRLRKSISKLNANHKILLENIADVFQIDQVSYAIKYEPYLKENDVFVMIKQGFHIGSHGCDHSYLTDLDLSTQVDHILSSVLDLCNRFGLSYRAFAFPYNDVGISNVVYETLFHGDKVQMTFGTSLMRMDCNARSIQRLNFENGPVSGRRILMEGLSKRALLQIAGQGIMTRL